MDILHHLDALVDFLWKDALVVFAIVWIHEGTRILAIGGQQRRGVRVLLPGIVIMVLMVALSLWISHMMGSFDEKRVLSAQAELPPTWGANMPSELRESSSRTYASTVFAVSGKTRHYFDQLSGWKPYCPSEKDIALRDESVATQTQLQQVHKEWNSAAYRWLDFGFLAALVGWFTGRKQRYESTVGNGDPSMIEYRDIPKYCDHIDKDKRSTVVLSRNQAMLYKRLEQNRLKPLGGLGRLSDMIAYSGTLLCVFVFAKNLLLLSQFRRRADARGEMVAIRELENGRVALTFNPHAEPNVINVAPLNS